MHKALQYHSPLEGESARGRSPQSSRRGANAASRRAGGGQTPRPVSQYQQYGKQRQSPWWISFVDFFFGRRGPASTPHRISLRLAARLLRLPLKGGVIINIGKRRQSPSWSFVPLRGFLFLSFVPLGGSPSYCPRLSPLAGARWPPNSGSGITRAR